MRQICGYLVLSISIYGRDWGGCIKQGNSPDIFQILTQCSAVSWTFVCRLWQNMLFAHLQNKSVY